MNSAISNESRFTSSETASPIDRRDFGSRVERIEGMHSQFGRVSVDPASTDFFEEASIILSSFRKFESKDNKKEKETRKMLEYLQRIVPDIPGVEKIERFLEHMQDSSRSGYLTEERIREAIREYSEDVTHQYLAMDAAVNYFRDNGENCQEIATALSDYNHHFYVNNKKDIQSGINVSSAAANYVKNHNYGSIQQLRDMWRQGLEIPDFQYPLEAYQFAKEKCGYREINKGISWLMEAHAVELSAMTSSVDPNHLKHVRSSLEVIYGLRTIIAFCKANENAAEKLSAQMQGL